MAQVIKPRRSLDGRRGLLVSRTWVQAAALVVLRGFSVLGFPVRIGLCAASAADA